MSVADCGVLDFPRRDDARGSLSFLEGTRHVPFGIKRIYYLYDIPEGAERGAHGHIELEQVFLAMHGGFELELDDGRERKTFLLDRPDRGVYVCPMMWREVRRFSPGAVCLVLASDFYDEADYIRDYDEFLKAVRAQ
jgi:hypothetical protein